MKIVFVHLDTQIPRFLQENIKFCARSFPFLEIVLITNVKYRGQIEKNMRIFNYEKDNEWSTMEKSLSHPKEFRGNFWLTSYGRFLAISQFLKIYDSEIIHVESDVIISKDFPFQIFSKIKKEIAYPLVSEIRGIASIIDFRNYSSCRKLVEHSIKDAIVNPQITDMLTLRSFFNLNKKIVQVIPNFPVSKSSQVEIFKTDFSYHLDKTENFKGIFDGNDIGVYIFGTNPFNKKSISFLRTDIPGNYFKASDFKYTYNNLREFVDVASDQGKFSVYALHITSKQAKFFKKFRRGQKLNIRLWIVNMGFSRYIVFGVLISISLKKILKLLKQLEILIRRFV